MSIFDRFKKTKKDNKETKAVPKKKAVKETPKKEKQPDLDDILNKPAAGPQAPVMQPKSGKRVEKKEFSQAYRILEHPQVTEKSGASSEKGIYIFRVKPKANKQEIKKAVRDLYGVAVKKVNIINIPKKFRRLGKSEGFKSGYKKAMVKLAEGEKIEIMPR